MIGFIDRDSALGRSCVQHQAQSVFYREATFYSADEVVRLLLDSGFAVDAWAQTLASQLEETREIGAL